MDNQESGVLANGKKDKQTGGVPAPTENIAYCLEMAQTIVAAHGTATPVSKEEISKETGKAVATLVMKISSCVQYSILNNVHGKGYQASDLFQKYSQPVYPNDEFIAKLKMFQSAPLYAKIIETLNNEVLPAEDKFANLLKNDTFRLNPNSAERAAKVFFENCRHLNLIDSSGRFRFNIGATTQNVVTQKTDTPEDQPKKEQKPQEKHPNMIEVTVPMKNKEKAYLRFPEDYTNEDMDKIARIVQAYKEMAAG